jgi:hypothetical protein
MAASCVISDTFQIYVLLDSASGHVVTNPGRAFKVTSIRAYNAGGTPTIVVAGAADIAASQNTATNAWKDLTLNTANTSVASGQNLTITNANASTTQVIIECIASSGYSLNIT